jgi:calcium-dependent protein kinase
MQKRGKFTEKDAAVVIKQVLSCINYCHLNNLVHRDLKPENIMLEDPKRLDFVKVIDFGTATEFTNKNPIMNEIIGTPYYIAPEVL